MIRQTLRLVVINLGVLVVFLVLASAATDASRATAGYQKTGDLITLPYTNSEFIKQPYATRVENVQTYLIQNWVGKITLSPSGDEWFETESVPALVINQEGNFNTIKTGLENRGVMGTVWNSWETQWSGVVSSVDDRPVSVKEGRTTTTSVRTTTTTRTDLRRTGLHTSVVENIEEESQGKRIISRALIPFIRPRTITVTGFCFRPGTKIHAFFDGRNVSSFITPASSTFSNVSSPVEGSDLITSGSGKVECTFRIPEYRFAGQRAVPKFRTGEIEFRLTSQEEINRKFN